jgi:large subunit ribosomal protein L21
MFAVVEIGGKQYKVSTGDKIKVEKFGVQSGGSVLLERVLLVDDGKETVLGTPYLPEAKVEAKVLSEGRHKKVIVFKIKPKKRYRKKAGHRQAYAQIEITRMARS